MRKQIMALASLLLVLVVGATFIDTFSESDADSTDGVLEVSDVSTLTSVFESATSGSTIRFTGIVPFTEVENISDGVIITSSTLENNQGIIVAVKTALDGTINVGSFKTLNEIQTALSTTSTNDELVLYCSPDSYVVGGGSTHHLLLCKDLIVNGNNATLIHNNGVMDGQVTFYIESTQFPSEVSMTFYDLKNLKVHGGRFSETNLTLNIINCDSSSDTNVGNDGLIMLRAGNYESTTKTTINIIGCELNKNHCPKDAIHVTTACTLNITDCTFDGSLSAINLNTKSASYGSTVSISDCVFTNCGAVENTDQAQYGAAIRIANAGSYSEMTTVSVNNCNFNNDASHPTVNGDVLIGDGREGNVSNDIQTTITETGAEVQFQKPGYYNGTASTTNDNLIVTLIVESSEILTSTGSDVIITDAPVDDVDTPTHPDVGDDDDDEFLFIPGNNTPQSSSGSDKTTLVAAAAAVVVIMLAVVAIMVTKNH